MGKHACVTMFGFFFASRLARTNLRCRVCKRQNEEERSTCFQHGRIEPQAGHFSTAGVLAGHQGHRLHFLRDSSQKHAGHHSTNKVLYCPSCSGFQPSHPNFGQQDSPSIRDFLQPSAISRSQNSAHMRQEGTSYAHSVCTVVQSRHITQLACSRILRGMQIMQLAMQTENHQFRNSRARR